MEALQPIINLLALLTALSMGAERLTNLWKLRNTDLRNRTRIGADKEREYAIAGRTLFAGFVVALVFKADFFAILHNLNDPWQTIGWWRLEGAELVLALEAPRWATAIYAVVGSLFTGVALGFGSKFWHDVLSTVYNIRDAIKR